MKRVTFNKPIKPHLGGWRPDFPGYLFTVASHPGREFVVCRGSTARPSEDCPLGFKFTEEWYVHERQSGYRLKGVKSNIRTDAHALAVVMLARLTPEKLQAHLDAAHLRHITEQLKG